ncbi:hypothetical protein EON79_01515 [bacterium]|nr:MAG: hypothetical protein EON79_01515 [bacterium]
MRRLLPFLLLLAGCGASHPIADKIDLPLPPGATITGTSEKDQGTQIRYEVVYDTDMKAKEIADFYKSKGLDALVQGATVNVVGTSPKGLLLKIDAAPKVQRLEVKIVAIQAKDAPR